MFWVRILLELVYLFSVGTGTVLAEAGPGRRLIAAARLVEAVLGRVDKQAGLGLDAGLDRRPIAAAGSVDAVLSQVDEHAGLDLEVELAVLNEVDEQDGLDLAAGLDRQPISAARCAALLREQADVEQFAVAALERGLAGVLVAGLGPFGTRHDAGLNRHVTTGWVEVERR